MLVVISDLHFGDGSATENVKPRAFALFLDHVLDLAEHARSKEVTLLFLGDVFDLLRTEYWFHPAPGRPLGASPVEPAGDPFPLQHRPWGDPRVLDDGSPQALTPECQARAVEIAQRIAAVCAPQLDILSGRNLELTGLEDEELRARVSAKLAATDGLTFRRLYLPGNHDRLARVLPAVAEVIRAALGAEPAVEGPTGLVAAPALGVVARHGHEWDGWNFQPRVAGKLDPDPDDFRFTPLGDVITTEGMARLPYRVKQLLLADEAPGRWINHVHAHLRGVEDVRPLGAVLRWVASVDKHLLRVVRTFRAEDGAAMAGADLDGIVAKVVGAVDKAAQEIVRDLVRLPYTRAWLRRRRWLRAGWVQALQLRLLALALRLFRPTQIAPVLEWGPVARWLARPDDSLRERAAQMLAGYQPPAGAARPRHAVLGHTHEYRHVPLRDPPDGVVEVYFNSGTWRPRIYETVDQSGFRSVKEMTYLVFHDDPASAGYETWNGVMLK